MIHAPFNLPAGVGCRVIMMETGTVIDVPDKHSPFDVLDRLFKKHPPAAADKAAADKRWDDYHAAPQPKQPDADDPFAPRGKDGELKRADVAAVAAGHKNPPAPTDRPKPPPPASPPEPKRPGVRDTSMAAYRALEYSGRITDQQRLVLARWTDGDRAALWTRQELARDLKLGINVICGRVNELLDVPLNLLYEAPTKKKCTVTGNDVNALGLATTPGGKS